MPNQSRLRRPLMAFLVLALLMTGIVAAPAPVMAAGCTEVLTNGGLESAAGWTVQSSKGYDLISPYLAHTGSRAAYLGGTDKATDRLATTLTVPENSSTLLRFWWQMRTQDTRTGNDGLSVLITDAAGVPLRTLFTITDANSVGVWQQAGMDLSAFAGQTVQLHFLAQTDAALVTDFFVDDVSVTACSTATMTNYIFLPSVRR